MMDEHNDQSTEVLAKAIRVLETLSQHPDGLLLHELATRLTQAKSSVHRILATWMRLGYVERSDEKRFRVGFRVVELAGRLQRNSSIVERSRSILAQLHQHFDESTYLGIYREGSVLLVDAIESTKPLRICIDLGEKCWLHASAQGKCVAAWLSNEVLAERFSHDLPKVTAYTNTSRSTLMAALSEVRKNGYCVNYQETVEGSVCFGAPFFAGRDGAVLGSLGIAVPTVRATAKIIADICATLPRMANELSDRLAGFPSEPDAGRREPTLLKEEPASQKAAGRASYH